MRLPGGRVGLPVRVRTQTGTTHPEPKLYGVGQAHPLACLFGRRNGHAVCGPLAFLFLFLAVYPARAQEERIRTLVYDPEHLTWVERAGPPMGTAEGDLHSIRVLNKEKKYRKALSAVKEFIKQYGRDHALYPFVLIAKAKALMGRRLFRKAHHILQEFLAEFAGIPATSQALRLEFVIAETYLRGTRRKIWGMRLFSGTETALKILDELSMDYPDSGLAELALKTKGDQLFARGEHSLAELEYARLLHDFPQSRYHQFALRRSADAALASFNGVEYDDEPLIEAEDRLNDYRASYPASAEHEGVDLILNDIREKRASKEFTIGRYYERTGHLTSAIYYYELVRKDWPGTIATTKATARLELLGALKPVASAGAWSPSAATFHRSGTSNP